jgi:hypothetical protein
MIRVTFVHPQPDGAHEAAWLAAASCAAIA